MAEREITALKLAYGVKPSAFENLWRGRKDGRVTYSVLPSPAPRPAEKRRDQRRRTRLRSEKSSIAPIDS